MITIFMVVTVTSVLVGVALFWRQENVLKNIQTRKRLRSAFTQLFPYDQNPSRAPANLWSDFNYRPVSPGVPPNHFYDLRLLVQRDAIPLSDIAQRSISPYSGSYPGWNGPYWQGPVDQAQRPVDPWGRPIRLRYVSNAGWQLLSLGVNGADNTGDSATPGGDDLVFPEFPYLPPYGGAIYLYYTVSDATSGYIGRVVVDGTQANHRFINTGTRDITAVAVNDTHIYWVETTNKRIRRCDLNGNNFTTVVTLTKTDCRGLALDSNYLYWTYEDSISTDYSSIGRYALNGSSTTHKFISGTDFQPQGVAVNNTHIYWASLNKKSIGRANIDGSSVNHNLISTITSLTSDAGFQVALDKYHVYWTRPLSSKVDRARLDGTKKVERLVWSGYLSSGLAVDRFIYWICTGEKSLGRSNLDGTDATEYLVTIPDDLTIKGYLAAR